MILSVDLQDGLKLLCGRRDFPFFDQDASEQSPCLDIIEAVSLWIFWVQDLL